MSPIPESRLSLFSSQNIATPAFVYDEAEIDRLLDHTDRLRAVCSCRVLYSLKPFSFVDVLTRMATRLDGFAVSSPFEARLARQITRDPSGIHTYDHPRYQTGGGG